jgi:hypothetical protein
VIQGATFSLTDAVYCADSNSSTGAPKSLVVNLGSTEKITISLTRFYASGAAGGGVYLSSGLFATLLMSDCAMHTMGASSSSGAMVGTTIACRIRFSSVRLFHSTSTTTGAVMLSGTNTHQFLEAYTSKFLGNGGYGHITIDNPEVAHLACQGCTFAGTSTQNTRAGIAVITNSYTLEARFDRCDFGVVAGINVAHTTADFNVTSTYAGRSNLIFVDSNLASPSSRPTSWRG